MQVIKLKRPYRVSYRTRIMEKNENIDVTKIEGGYKTAKSLVDRGYAIWMKHDNGEPVRTALQSTVRKRSAEEIAVEVERKEKKVKRAAQKEKAPIKKKVEDNG